MVVSPDNTAEPSFLVNRSGNGTSQEQADVYLEKVAALCRRAGFCKITYRGDSDFSQTGRLDRWDRDVVRLVFGIDDIVNLKGSAERLPGLAHSELVRQPTLRSRSNPARPASGTRTGSSPNGSSTP